MINSKEYIEELEFSLRKQDKIKVNLVINDFEVVDPKTQRMAVDMLAENKSELAIKELKKLLGVGSVYLKNHAKERLVKLGGRVLPVLIENLTKDNNSELLIHTLNVLGDIGDSRAVSPIRKLLISLPEDPNIRFAAYEALGKVPVKACAYTLASGLEDPVEDVAISAAKAIDSNYNSVLCSGLKNIFKDAGEGLERLIEIIIISEAGNIFLSLMENKLFLLLASQYLKEKACSDIILYFVALLKENGYASLACEIAASKDDGGYDEKEVWVVDDSRMILSIYGKTLYSLGVKSKRFEFPRRVIESLRHNVPALLFTDLNMPDITGIELVKDIRRTYSIERLPIVMVTTQSDIEDSGSLLSIGVSKVLHKPFTKELLREAISEFTPGLIESFQL